MFEGSDFGLQELLLMFQGAGVTLAITFWAVLGGTLMGVVFGLVRAVAPWWINWPLGAVLDVFRSIPLLIQLVLVELVQVDPQARRVGVRRELRGARVLHVLLLLGDRARRRAGRAADDAPGGALARPHVLAGL